MSARYVVGVPSITDNSEESPRSLGTQSTATEHCLHVSLVGILITYFLQTVLILSSHKLLDKMLSLCTRF